MPTDALAVFFREHDEVMARSQYRDDIAKAHEILKALFKKARIRAAKDVQNIHASRTYGTHVASPDAIKVVRLLRMGVNPDDYETVLDCMTSQELAMVVWCANQLAAWMRQAPVTGADHVAQKYMQIGTDARDYFSRKHGYLPEQSPTPDRPITLDEARAYLKKLEKDVGQPSLFDTVGDDNE